MARSSSLASNILVAINFITLLLSIPVIIVGLWLASRHHLDCLSFLQAPIIFIGVAMFFVSLVGLVGARSRSVALLWFYVLLLFLIILLLLSFTLFTFFVTSGGGGHPVPGAVFLEYKLTDFSLWFQDRVTNPYNWQNLKLCLQEKQFCGPLNEHYPILPQFDRAELSPLQSGCCKPPTACGYKFVHPTQWENATTPSADADCGRWDNNPYVLCFSCDSCRAGLLQNVKEDWAKVGKVCLVVLIAVVVLYFLALLTFIKAQWEEAFTPHGFTMPWRPRSAAV